MLTLIKTKNYKNCQALRGLHWTVLHNVKKSSQQRKNNISGKQIEVKTVVFQSKSHDHRFSVKGVLISVVKKLVLIDKFVGRQF